MFVHLENLVTCLFIAHDLIHQHHRLFESNCPNYIVCVLDICLHGLTIHPFIKTMFIMNLQKLNLLKILDDLEKKASSNKKAHNLGKQYGENTYIFNIFFFNSSS